NPITQQDDDQVDGLWQNADGDQMWAPTSYFCPDSADTPTPTDEPTDTPTSTPTVIPSEVPTPAPAASTGSAPVSKAAARAPVPVQVIERTVVVVATPTDPPDL